MSKIYTDSQHYTDIAAAIRYKLGGSETYKPAEMATAIRSIEPPASGGATALCYWEEVLQETGVAHTFTSPISEGLCVVIVLHRGIIVTPSGWTLLHTTEGAVNGSTVQRVSVFYKSFTSASISFTYTFETGTDTRPVHYYIFKNAGIPTISKSEEATTGQHISAAKNVLQAVIWCRHEIYWWSDSSYGWKCSDGWFANYVEEGDGRLCTVVDYTYGKTLDIYPSGTLSVWAGEYFGIAVPGEVEEETQN